MPGMPMRQRSLGQLIADLWIMTRWIYEWMLMNLTLLYCLSGRY